MNAIANSLACPREGQRGGGDSEIRQLSEMALTGPARLLAKARRIMSVADRGALDMRAASQTPSMDNEAKATAQG